MKTGDSNGKTVGIPLSTTALAVTYNPTVIEQAGAEVPSDDWTWDDYITLMKKLQSQQENLVHLQQQPVSLAM